MKKTYKCHCICFTPQSHTPIRQKMAATGCLNTIFQGVPWQCATPFRAQSVKGLSNRWTKNVDIFDIIGMKKSMFIRYRFVTITKYILGRSNLCSVYMFSWCFSFMLLPATTLTVLRLSWEITAWWPCGQTIKQKTKNIKETPRKNKQWNFQNSSWAP